MRVRLIATGNTINIPYSIYSEESIINSSYQTPFYNGFFNVVPNIDNVYEIQLPKGIISSVFRITLGPTLDPFHRYNMALKVTTSGMESDSKWFQIQ
jgi:hypothetical protein